MAEDPKFLQVRMRQLEAQRNAAQDELASFQAAVVMLEEQVVALAQQLEALKVAQQLTEEKTNGAVPA